MSTSEGSENEDEGKEKSVALDGGPDEADGGDDDDEGGAASAANGSNPEVKCMWEDCGQIFTSLAPFISHLHDGESRAIDSTGAGVGGRKIGATSWSKGKSNCAGD